MRQIKTTNIPIDRLKLHNNTISEENIKNKGHNEQYGDTDNGK